MSNSIGLSMPDLGPDPIEANLSEIIPNVELIDDDGEPLETDWHRRAMNLLLDSMDHHFREREDFFAGGNMFVYFSVKQARNNDFRGPDFFFVWKTTRQPQRRYWCVWEENGRTPNVVIELTSPTTRAKDHGEKKDIYEQVLHVADYFCFDPDGDRLEGWRLHGREYMSLKLNEKGWAWSEELKLWIGAWKGIIGGYDGIYPRFYDPAGNLVLTEREAALILAEQANQRAEQANQRAEQECHRREAAEAELALLRERLTLLDKSASKNGENGKK